MKIVFNSSPLIFLSQLGFLEKFLDSNDNFYLPATVQQEINAKQDRFFGLCYAMYGGYKGWNPYREKRLAIFVNCF